MGREAAPHAAGKEGPAGGDSARAAGEEGPAGLRARATATDAAPNPSAIYPTAAAREEAGEGEEAKSERRFPVASSASMGAPRPVSLTLSGPPGREVRMWKKPDHCSPCMMSRSMMWTRSSRSNASWMAWFAVKCENWTKELMPLNTWNAAATRPCRHAAAGDVGGGGAYRRRREMTRRADMASAK
ncbi:hypothetical protein C2845_PM03G27730 [Panicum miliaceum]|uniref:Uncharacterized protein n=1 Tax=Panicum miliaceum TaxID=4540 RepID=A0A3L6T902_PANMI|nr:hypothetical protein C2845_PM03G27730 [Panicum miliaceum]